MKKTALVLFVAILCILAASPTEAQPVLDVTIVNGYNLIVDSNVTAPPTYAPRSAYIGAQVCNTGNATATDVIANVGNFNGGVGSTPGIFPVTTFGADALRPQLAGTGSYSLSLTGSRSDGLRYIGALLAGECRIQYWLFTYPACVNISDGAGGFTGQEPPCNVSITGGIKPQDDLTLNYDVWATSPSVTTNSERRDFTMRNEISAAANKIWPNTTSKVPDDYLTAIQSVLGWGTLGPDGQPLTSSNPVYPGQRVITTQGIWYDLGNVGAGFDNDGDLVPDSNAWLQPVGDYTKFDSDCFRMVKVYGIVVVKLTTGGELLIPFVDELYFEHLPNNTGVVGLVYYQYIATGQGCSANMSPYQEAASGFDNEKFSGDYGLNLGLNSGEFGTALSFSKSDGVGSIATGGTLNYTGTANNSGTGVNLGAPDLGVPLIFVETIPAGTTFVAGSADDSPSTNLTEPTGTGSYFQGYTDTAGNLDNCPINYNITSSSFVIFYSNDNGVSYSLTEPGGVTNIRWALFTVLATDGGHDRTNCLAPNGIFNQATDVGPIQTSLPVGKSATFRFSVTVSSNPGPIICNTAAIGFGSVASNKTSTDCTVVTGNNSLAGSIFKDDGAGGGTYGNGTKDNVSEIFIGSGVSVNLYYDLNADGKLDAGDIFYGSTTTTTGAYSFTNLADGRFIVVAKKFDGTARTLSGTTVSGSSFVTSAGRQFKFTDVGSTISGTGIPGGTTITAFNSTSSVTLSAPATFSSTTTLTLTPNTAVNDAVMDSTFAFTGFGNTTRDPKLSLASDQGILKMAEEFTYVTLAVNIDLDGNNAVAQNITQVNFAFAPPLLVTKTVTSTTVDEGDLFTYAIGLKNRLPSVGVQGPTGCQYTAWSTTGTNGSPAGKAFTDPTNAWDGPNRTIATALISGGGNRFIIGSTFGLSTQAGNVTKVEALTMGYFNTTLTNDFLTISATLGATTSVSLGTALISSYVGPPADLDPNSAISADFTSSRPGGGSWTFADFSTLTIRVDGDKASAADAKTLAVDAIGIRVTTDTACEAGASTTLSPVPVRDQFDTTNLEFVSAVPSPTSVSGGTITWSDVGPITPGSTTTLFVTMRAKDVNGTSTGTCGALPSLATNCNFVEGGYTGNNVFYADGRIANNASASVPVTIVGKAELRGFVWKDTDDDGWAIEAEPALPNVSVSLYACVNSAGAMVTGASNTKDCEGLTANNKWSRLGVTTTDTLGAYQFIGLDSGYYIIEVGDTDGLPTGGNTSPFSGAQSAEADDDQSSVTTNADGHDCPGHGSGGAACNNIWGATTAFLRADQTTINFLDAGTEETVNNINFGYYITTAFLYGNIWHDNNGNATRDAQDGDLSGFTVARWSDPNGDGNPADGVLQATTTSDANGDWSFSGLSAASYVIIVTPPTLLNNVWTETVESTGGTGSLNNQIPVTLTAGQVSGSHDFGYTLTSSSDIGDSVYYDFDSDGVQDAGETGISGVTVWLYTDEDRDGTIDAGVDALVATTVTDSTGKYLFPNYAEGNYIVKVDTTTLPSNVTATGDPDISSGTIGDLIWLDSDRDLTKDANEDGIAGVVVRLWQTARTASSTTASGNTTVTSASLFLASDVGRTITGTGIPPGTTITGFTSSSAITISAPATASATNNLTMGDIVGSAVTDVNGNYLFTGLNAGDYFVSIDPSTLPSSILALTTADPGATVASLATNGASSTILTKDAGYAPSTNFALGNRVWHDRDGDNVQDAGEVGISGLTVTVTRTTAGPCNPTACTAITDEAGNWLVTGLTAGSYTVAVSGLATDFLPTSTLATQTIAAADIMTADIGYRYKHGGTAPEIAGSPTGTISGRIIEDADGDLAYDGRTVSSTTTSGSATVTSAALFLSTDVGKRICGTGIPNDAIITGFNNTSSVTISTTATTNATNIMNVGEAMCGTTVNLLDDNNHLIATTTTAADGTYSFTGVFIGEYSVQTIDQLGTRSSTVFLSAGAAFPNLNVIYNKTSESTADNQGSAYVDGVYSNLQQDFGYRRLFGSIGDTVYHDANENATQDLGEPGFSGVTVRLYRLTDTDNDGVADVGETLTLLETKVTTADDPLTAEDESGKYLFANVDAPATGFPYVVEVDIATIPGTTKTLIADPDSDGVPCPTLSSPQNAVCDNRDVINAAGGGAGFSAGTNYLGADFGYQISGPNFGKIGDNLWIDSDADGLRDAGELGVPRITVFLDTNNNGALDWTDSNANGIWDAADGGERWVETDVSGYYLFTGLATGSYNVRVRTADADWPSGLSTDPTFQVRCPTGLFPTVGVPCVADEASATDNLAVVTINASGVVSNINDGFTNAACTNCDLSTDFGYRYTGSNTLSGTVCIDDVGLNGYCGSTVGTFSGVTASAESALAGVEVLLYNWVDTDVDNTPWNGSGVLDPGDTFTLIGSTSTNAIGDYNFSNVPNRVVTVMSVAPSQALRLTTTVAGVVDVGADSYTNGVNGLYEATTIYGGATVTEITRRAFNFVDGVDAGTTVTVQNVDFAFNPLISKDFGDLPDSGGTDYNATLLSAGAQHRIGTLFLGAGITAERDGQDSPTAALDSDDGVYLNGNAITIVPTDFDATISYAATGAGWLVGWFDFNQNGNFESTERIISQAVASDTRSVTTTATSTNLVSVGLFSSADLGKRVSGAGIPADTYIVGFIDASNVTLSNAATTGATSARTIWSSVSFEIPTGSGLPSGANIPVFARFRLYPEQPTLMAPTGPALDSSFQAVTGEVEDYRFVLAVTQASVTSFLAREMNGSVAIEWETSSESGTAGFLLRRWDNRLGGYVEVTDKLLPSVLMPQGGLYRFIDPAALPGVTYGYELVEVEASGARNVKGPYSVNTDSTHAIEAAHARPASASGPDPGPTGYAREARITRRPAGGRAARDADFAASTSVPAQGAKLGVSKRGIHYVSVQDLTTRAGLTVDKNWLNSARNVLDLSRGGVSVPFAASGDGKGILFFGEALNSEFSRDNVYGLGPSARNVPRMRVRSDSSPRPAVRGDETFSRVVSMEQDVYASPNIFKNPEGDFWVWDYVYAGWGAKTFGFLTDGARRSGDAFITVRLKGGTDTEVNPDHHAVIRLNGELLGELTWDGINPIEAAYQFDARVLNAGENTLEIDGLTDTGAPYSLFYLDSFDVRYDSLYRATSNRFEGTSGNHPSIRISGFTRSDVMVFDVTDPREPVVVTAPVLRMPTGDYAVTLTPRFPNIVYHAVAGDAVLPVAWVEKDAASSLRSDQNRAEYIIITTRALMSTAQTLADYRSDLSSKVVDIEDIYDEFNFGVSSPHAVKAFLAHARATWPVGPRYVLLAGDGTWDYKDLMGMGNQVPPMLVNTPSGLFPSDVWFADVDPKGAAPEFAIGRLPVATPEEFAQAIVKIKQREAAVGSEWLKRVLMVTDNADVAGDFLFDSSRLSAVMPQGSLIERIDLSTLGPDQARSLLINGINAGVGTINYIGHGGYNVLADEGILGDWDMAYLTNPDRSPVMTAMTCLVGNFALPWVPSLGETLVRKGNAGLAALWAPTGMSENEFAVRLARSFHSATRPGVDKQRLGDAVQAAMSEYERSAGPTYMMAIYALLGDPAMRLY